MALAYNSNGFGTMIQSITKEGVTIIWFTTTQEDSQVKLGTTQGTLNMIYTDTTPAVLTSDGVYKHTMRIRGLASNTKYFYSVGSSGFQLFGNTVNEFFYTAPDYNTAQPMRFWALADYGHTGGQVTARNAFTSFNGRLCNICSRR